MNKELVFFLLPIVAFLWQAGGTWKKQYRRIGFPVAATLAVLLFIGFEWWLPLFAGACFAVTTLPFTFIGDGLPEHWFNWVWVWITGYILGLPAFLIGFDAEVFLMATGSMLAHGIFGTLSNIPATAKYFPWKFCEGAFGFFVAFPVALTISWF